MPDPMPVWRRAQKLVEETQENIDRQREVVADLERRGLNPAAAQKLLIEYEEALVRRTEILNEIRTRAQEKRDRK
jgi:hypothetical protein